MKLVDTVTQNEKVLADEDGNAIEFAYATAYELPVFSTLNWFNEGYDFSGWQYVNDSGETKQIVVFANETGTFKDLTATDGKEVTLTAVWSIGKTTFSAYILLETLDGAYNTSLNPEGAAFVEVSTLDLRVETETKLTAKKVYEQFIVDTSYANVTGFAYDESIQDTTIVTVEGITKCLALPL